jgi:micrococcal nuclease
MRLINMTILLWMVTATACADPATVFEPGEEGLAFSVSSPMAIIITVGEERMEARLAGIDAVDDFRSREWLSREVIGRNVQIAYDGLRRDRYDRALAQLYIRDGDTLRWVQGEMVEAGVARVLSHSDNSRATPQLLLLEQDARQAGRGLWADTSNVVRSTNPDVLVQDIGSVQIVAGRVIDATRLSSGRVYLNFGGDYRTDFTVVIESRDMDAFDEAGLDPMSLETHLVRVRGWIDEENGPMMRLDHPARIEILQP